MTCDDLGFPGILQEVSEKTTVRDVLQTASVEWDVIAKDLALSFSGELLPEATLLVSHGVGPEAELVVSRKQIHFIFDVSYFENDNRKQEMMTLHEESGDKHLSIDTPTFAIDGTLTLGGRYWLPEVITSVWFRNSKSSVTTVGDSFMGDCTSVTAVDLSGLSSVCSIGDTFLQNCSLLTNFNTSGLSNVRVIGNYFLLCCSSLQSLDLSNLSNVTSIGDDFLACCSLTEINLSGLGSVQTVGDRFLSTSMSVRTIDMSMLSSVTSIGDKFLYECTRLTCLDLSGFGSLISIGSRFLGKCRSMVRLDFSSMSKVTKIGKEFLLKCPMVVIQLPETNERIFLKINEVKRVVKTKKDCTLM